MYNTPRDFRPNTRKIYEDHHKVSVLPDFHVHHKLPVRLGGDHSPENLVALTKDEHVKAHLDLHENYGDPRDLCAAHMIGGFSREAHLIAAGMGGRASQVLKRENNIPNGFQLFSPEKRKAIASKAGRVGAATQIANREGIHTKDQGKRREWARLGAEAVKEQFSCSERQASRGRKGGPKNKGFKWYRDAESKPQKYTPVLQKVESFEAFIKRTGFLKGRGSVVPKGSKFYNNGIKQWMFNPSKHDESYEDFVQINGFIKGRLK